MNIADDISWVDPSVVPNAMHLIHHSDIWCIVNAKGEVAVYQLGTARDKANSVQGNTNKAIVDRLVNRFHREAGAVGVSFVKHLFLPDSPGRY